MKSGQPSGPNPSPNTPAQWTIPAWPNLILECRNCRPSESVDESTIVFVKARCAIHGPIWHRVLGLRDKSRPDFGLNSRPSPLPPHI